MRRLLAIIFILVPRVICNYFLWINRYARHPEKYDLSKRYYKARKLINYALKIFKSDVIVIGADKVPNEICCFYANHVGACDPLPFFKALENKPIAFVGKVEIKKMPFVGKVFTAIDSLFLDRSDLKQQLRVMMSVEKSLKEKSTSWVIYPEGTRNKDTNKQMRTFHHGTFRSAVKAEVPLVPVVEYGSFRLLKFKGNLKKYPTIIKFLDPIYPSEYLDKKTEEIAKIVESRIQTELDYNIRKLYHEEMVKLNDINYRSNKIY